MAASPASRNEPEARLRASAPETQKQYPISRQLEDVERARRERVKELECMYAVSNLYDTHVRFPERFLQGVADCLPRSWRYPEQASARIVYAGRHYVSSGDGGQFRPGPWRMAVEVGIDGQKEGIVEVFYCAGVPTGPDGPFLKEEYALLRVVAERVYHTLGHMKAQTDLEAAHRLLQNQNEALQETNIALRAVLARLEDEKRDIRASILANIQKIIMPIVFELELAVSGETRSYVTLLRQTLQEIASPFVSQLAANHLELSPTELTIATMIRNGLSTKEIARIRGISAGTIRRHRENIRRKLGLRNRKANLVTSLQAFAQQAGELGRT